MQRRRSLVLAAVFGLTALLATSCGGSGSGGASAASTTVRAGGEPSAETTFFFTLTADSGSLDGERLTLAGVAPSVLAVAERPARSSYQQDTATFVERFGAVFGTDSPNAVLVADGGGEANSMALTVSEPELDQATNTVTFVVEATENQDVENLTFGLGSLTLDSAPGVDGGEAADGIVTLDVDEDYPDGPVTTTTGEARNTRWTVSLDSGGDLEVKPQRVVLGGRGQVANNTGRRLHLTIKENDDVLFEGFVDHDSRLTFQPR